MKRATHIRILGLSTIPIKWEKDLKDENGERIHGEYDGLTDEITMSEKTTQPASVVLHEAWHAYNRRMSDDDTTKDDAAARRVETFFADMCVYNWDLVLDFRKESLKRAKKNNDT